MSQTGTPQITAQDVLAQLQTDTKVLALMIASLQNPVALTLNKDPTWPQLQQTSTILLAAMQRFVGFLGTQIHSQATPTPADISTAAGPVYVTDSLSRNIVCTGAIPAQVYTSQPVGVWVSLPATTDGGQVYQNQSDARGQTLTLYNCVPGLLQGAAPPTS
jgi:hypothetical protein